MKHSKCFKSKKKDSVSRRVASEARNNPPVQRENNRNPRNQQNQAALNRQGDSERIRMLPEQRGERAQVEANIPPKKISKVLQIVTNINEDNLILSESKPSPQTLKYVKYLCPICFRYFNKILQFSCCKNYICLYCAEDINDALLAGAGKMTAKCAFCSNEQCVIKDVRPTSDVITFNLASDLADSCFGTDSLLH